MLSASTFDLIAAAFFILGCGLLFFALRYARRTNQQPTTHERNTDE